MYMVKQVGPRKREKEKKRENFLISYLKKTSCIVYSIEVEQTKTKYIKMRATSKQWQRR